MNNTEAMNKMVDQTQEIIRRGDEIAELEHDIVRERNVSAEYKKELGHLRLEVAALKKLVYETDQGEGGAQVTWKESCEAADNACHAWKLATDEARLEVTHLQQALEELENRTKNKEQFRTMLMLSSVGTRTANVLSDNFNSHLDLVDFVAKGWKLTGIDGIGKAVEKEILAWLSQPPKASK